MEELTKIIVENFWILLFSILAYFNRPTRIYAIILIGLKILFPITNWVLIILLIGVWANEFNFSYSKPIVTINTDALKRHVKEVVEEKMSEMIKKQ